MLLEFSAAVLVFVVLLDLSAAMLVVLVVLLELSAVLLDVLLELSAAILVVGALSLVLAELLGEAMMLQYFFTVCDSVFLIIFKINCK